MMRDVGWDNLGKQRGSAQGCGMVVFVGLSPGLFLSSIRTYVRSDLVARSILRISKIFFFFPLVLASRPFAG